MKREGKSNTLLQSGTPVVKRVSCIIDFRAWFASKFRPNIGKWLEEAHNLVVIKSDYIGSHTVDGAPNAKSSVHNLQWQTSDSRSQKIIAESCDAHKCNISAGIASRTTDHVVNLNPVCGESLNKLHDWLTKILRNGLCTKVYNNVLNE